MGGYVTQTRKTDKVLRADVSYYAYGQPQNYPTTHLTLNVPGTQTTTSYRSGRTLDESVITPQDLQVFQPARFVVGTHDSGHEFSTTRTSLLTTTHLSNFWLLTGRYTHRLEGDVILSPSFAHTTFGMPSGVDALSLNRLKVLGGRAINATIPTKPEAGLTQFLGELYRDGIPDLPSYNLISKARTRDLGGEYLNIEFGWKPLVTDIIKLMQSVKKSAEILRQFKRDSGRIVRRRFAFPQEHTSSTSEPYDLNGSSGTHWPLNESYYWDRGQITTTDVTTEDVWFSGAYSYYLDVGESLMSKANEFEQKANHLLGTRLTADVLYDLAPWSWLIDWHATVGLALSNVSALQEDGLVIRYGYLMRHVVTMRTVRSNPGYEGHGIRTPISTLYRTERKERWKATPYGFGLDLVGYTPRQWAILAALGLSQAPGRMK